MPDSSLKTSGSLLLRLRDAGDADAWRTFVETYAPLIHRSCRRRGLQDADAADVTQEVLAQVARSIRTFEYQRERGRFRDWLGTVVRQKLARFWGKKARDAGGEDEGLLDQAAAPGADAEWAAEFGAHVLQVALARIRPQFEEPTWRAFELAWCDNRTADEAARELGLSIDKVYVAKSRVLKRLREEVLTLAEDLPPCVPLH
jgi:RNA polymerase sigma-70 factor (ECF subfamily)